MILSTSIVSMGGKIIKENIKENIKEIIKENIKKIAIYKEVSTSVTPTSYIN